MKALKEILSGLLYCAAGIGLAYCVIFTVAFCVVVMTMPDDPGAEQDLCTDIVKAFNGEKGR